MTSVLFVFFFFFFCREPETASTTSYPIRVVERLVLVLSALGLAEVFVPNLGARISLVSKPREHGDYRKHDLCLSLVGN